jgi:antitoxin (DNA-binding transcriptional repressor) of toxin-antitoxin stability system
MQTLTITKAKKNLGRLLQAAAKGEDIGIISGDDIIALRKVEVEAADYAQREYGLNAETLEEFGQATSQRFAALKKQGKLTITTAKELRELLEKTTRS